MPHKNVPMVAWVQRIGKDVHRQFINTSNTFSSGGHHNRRLQGPRDSCPSSGLGKVLGGDNCQDPLNSLLSWALTFRLLVSFSALSRILLHFLEIPTPGLNTLQHLITLACLQQKFCLPFYWFSSNISNFPSTNIWSYSLALNPHFPLLRSELG